MTDEERTEVQECAQKIAFILHKDSKNREPEKLKILEGIEIEVREQIQKSEFFYRNRDRDNKWEKQADKKLLRGTEYYRKASRETGIKVV